jgi:hypothetical protein
MQVELSTGQIATLHKTRRAMEKARESYIGGAPPWRVAPQMIAPFVKIDGRKVTPAELGELYADDWLKICEAAAELIWREKPVSQRGN